MFDETHSGVVITSGRSGLRLTRVGAPELGYPTLIEVQAGPFSGSVRDDTVTSYVDFREQLAALYGRLTGTAELGSYEGVFSLALAGDGKGAIKASVVLIADHFPSIKLAFEFEIDQTYLPEIIRRIGDEFPGT